MCAPRVTRHTSIRYTRLIVCGKNLNNVSTCAVSPVVHTSNICSCQKIFFFSFPVAVKNSIKVGPLVFLLQMFVITKNITKRPVLCVIKILKY